MPDFREDYSREMEYLEDLLDRMSSTEWLPAGPDEVAMSGTHQVSFIAYREAEKLDDEALLEPLEAIIRSGKPKPRFQNALFVTACLVNNTESEKARQLLSSVFDNPGLNNTDLCRLLSASAKCRLASNEEQGLALLTHHNSDVVSDAAEYLIAIKSREGVKRIGELIQASTLGVSAVIHIGDIGEEWIKPILENIVSSKQGLKRKEDKECLGYATLALRKL